MGEHQKFDPEALDVPIGDGIDFLASSRRELRDLAALLVLPTMWVDHDPAYIATGLLGVLFAVLRLECGYVRFDDPAGGTALERWRPDGSSRLPLALEPFIAAPPAHEQGIVTVSVALPSSDGFVRVARMSPALPGENGLVLVGARRADFPTERELYLLRVAVGQATISIYTARRLAVERAARLAAEMALSLRNAFLARLAEELALPLEILSERAAQARAFVAEADQSQPLVNVVEDSVGNVSGSLRPETSGPSLSFPSRLSRREAEVLGLLAQGLSNREIAGILWLSERTVERHITSLYRKIGVERRSEATAFALRHSLVDDDKSDKADKHEGY